MAIFNKSLSLLSFATMFLMLLNNAHSADVITFQYYGFTENVDKLIFQGNAKVNSDSNLVLTEATQKSVGRILYSDEVQLWEKGTSRISTFETTITFNITSTSSNPADGIAFFIAEPDSTIPKDSYGGYLGLFPPSTALDPTKNKVFAVELDSFTGNSWDPNYRHIGIDVNTIKSSATVKWDIQDGAIGTIRINYNSNTKNLTVVSSYPGGKPYQVYEIVNLKDKLPEKVRVGLSASTGDYVQVNTINSWYFTSTLVYTKTKNNNEGMYISSVV